MGWTSGLLIAVLVVIAFLAVRSTVKRLSRGCCGTGGEGSAPRARVRDRNRSHYPYRAVLKIDGMVCGNCARRVEQALQALGGVLAEADVSGGRVTVRMKGKLSEETLRGAVNDIGPYTVLSIEWEAA